MILLARHGETKENRERRFQGQKDVPLSGHGREQARALAEQAAEEPLAALYTSPLVRAHDTARAIAESTGLAARLEPALAEYDLGAWEGKSYRELHATHRLWDEMRRDPDFAPHGGESRRQVTERVTQALRRIEAEHRGERVIVVAHGGALALALAALVDGDAARWDRVMANCAVSELVLAPAPALLSFDRRDHLDGI